MNSTGHAMNTRDLPEWAGRIRRKYTGGEASIFLLHGNVYDRYGYGDQFLSLTEFLSTVLLAGNKPDIALLDPSQGLRIVKRAKDADEVFAEVDDPYEVGPGTWKSLENRFFTKDGNALIINYAANFFPAAPSHFLSAGDRAAVVTVHRWSLSQQLADRDNVVFLVSESLSEINPQLVSNPRIAAIEIPLPDEATRTSVICRLDPSLHADQVQRLAAQASGLRALQLAVILKPQADTGLEDQERHRFILSLIGNQPDAASRATKLASLTSGMSSDEIRHLINPEAPLPETEEQDPLAELLELMRARKREVIEKECAGLIEFIESKHGLEAVGGMDGIKKELLSVAEAVRSGDVARIPMGLLFVGAMGTGKTFVAKAFARSSGLTAIALKNFRDRWVGSTEANLEKVLTMIRALGPIILVIDEGDRAFGSESGETDGGTSSRVMARLKAFMSDPENRGRVLFILMTNRPDKLDVDIKRAGRLDRKIPFFYPGDASAVNGILKAILDRHGVPYQFDEAQLEAVLGAMCDYSIADIEAVGLLAHDLAGDAVLGLEHLQQAVTDYLPARDLQMIEYMELLAVFEASRRSMLPPKYASLDAQQLTALLAEKRALLRI
ncbi:MAG: ATP-binding protein [Gammaproteobacteria bacterium]